MTEQSLQHSHYSSEKHVAVVLLGQMKGYEMGDKRVLLGQMK
jgi:hypothetical protein